jgi:hypothetical protein
MASMSAHLPGVVKFRLTDAEREHYARGVDVSLCGLDGEPAIVIEWTADVPLGPQAQPELVLPLSLAESLAKSIGILAEDWRRAEDRRARKARGEAIDRG